MSLIRNAFRRLHYPVDIIAQCVRRYLAYSLSLRNLEEIMAERGIVVDHSTLHRWVSGSTCVAAAQSGRRWIGIELKEQYHAAGLRRLAEFQRPRPVGSPVSPREVA